MFRVINEKRVMERERAPYVVLVANMQDKYDIISPEGLSRRLLHNAIHYETCFSTEEEEFLAAEVAFQVKRWKTNSRTDFKIGTVIYDALQECATIAEVCFLPYTLMNVLVDYIRILLAGKTT